MIAVRKLTKGVIALFMIPALLIAGPALAVAPSDPAPSVTVRFYDLNLNTTEGAASLYGRIHRAAIDVCRPLDDSEISNLATLSAWNECVAHSVADAVRRIHSEKLSAYQWQRIRAWRFRSEDAPINLATR